MKTMRCPKCLAAMLPDDVDGTRFSVCPACDGVWFDHVQLTTCLERYGRAAIYEQITEASRTSGTRSGMGCPACGNRLLVAVVIGALELDSCPGCSGLFLDKGELALVAGRDLARNVDPDTLEQLGAGIVSVLEALARAIIWGRLP